MQLQAEAQFQSTPSARRATSGNLSEHFTGKISIHALREESDQRLRHCQEAQAQISIHALREESDSCRPKHRRPKHNFNPRPPRGERHNAAQAWGQMQSISIHALREESDYTKFTTTDIILQFQSTPSARRATQQTNHHHKRLQFQSTPSARRATVAGANLLFDRLISIHALREESDQLSGFFYDSHHKFQSTPSARRATGRRGQPDRQRQISIHALREESDTW